MTTYASVMFASPISGTVKEIVRGAERRILAVVVESDGTDSDKEMGQWNGSDRDSLVAHMASGGAFREHAPRPFDVLANPADPPRAIYVSGFDSSPLAVNTGLVVEGRIDDLQRGVDALGVLAGPGRRRISDCRRRK